MNVPVTTNPLGGGGARSPLWRQIQADVYNHEVEIVEAEEGAAYGAQFLQESERISGPRRRSCEAIVRVSTAVVPQSKDSKTYAEELRGVSQDLPRHQSDFQYLRKFVISTGAERPRSGRSAEWRDLLVER